MQEQEYLIGRVQADLARMRLKLDSLKAKAQGADGRDQTRYTRYLAEIEKKRDQVCSRLDELATDGESAKIDIEKGLKEAWDRIAIATEAARARFH